MAAIRNSTKAMDNFFIGVKIKKEPLIKWPEERIIKTLIRHF